MLYVPIISVMKGRPLAIVLYISHSCIELDLLLLVAITVFVIPFKHCEPDRA
jgi:hypothetical protein